MPHYTMYTGAGTRSGKGRELRDALAPPSLSPPSSSSSPSSSYVHGAWAAKASRPNAGPEARL